MGILTEDDDGLSAGDEVFAYALDSDGVALSTHSCGGDLAVSAFLNDIEAATLRWLG